MPAQTTADLISEMRLRVGDTNTSDPFLTDAQWGNILDTAERKLSKYLRVEDDDKVVGDGSSEYAIPDGAINCLWTGIYKRSGEDNSTRRELSSYQTHGGKIYLSSPLCAGEQIVFWIRRPYIIGTDELTEDALEILYKLCEIEFINHAIMRRSDYVQWASLNRSDASINQLLIAKQELKRDLADCARDLGDGTDVSGLARW